MKKLMMLAAAMTIVGSAYGQCGEPPVGSCALVYDVQVTLKTTVPIYMSGSTTVCGEAQAAACWRKPGSASWKGFISACACDCLSFLGGSIYLWDVKNQQTLADGTGTLTWEVFNLIGPKKLDVEGFWSLNDQVTGAEVYGAGFGKWDAKNARLTSISGNVVAKLTPPACATGDCAASVAFPCSILITQGTESFTIAYGTWSMRYNSAASKKYAASTTLPTLPTWF